MYDSADDIAHDGSIADITHPKNKASPTDWLDINTDNTIKIGNDAQEQINHSRSFEVFSNPNVAPTGAATIGAQNAELPAKPIQVISPSTSCS